MSDDVSLFRKDSNQKKIKIFMFSHNPIIVVSESRISTKCKTECWHPLLFVSPTTQMEGKPNFES